MVNKDEYIGSDALYRIRTFSFRALYNALYKFIAELSWIGDWISEFVPLFLIISYRPTVANRHYGLTLYHVSNLLEHRRHHCNYYYNYRLLSQMIASHDRIHQYKFAYKAKLIRWRL